jgi:hypothetical protein
MNLFPSSSQTVDPFPLAKNKGVPPTLLKARTGEFTPPGNKVDDSSKSRLDCVRLSCVIVPYLCVQNYENRIGWTLKTR